MEGLNKINKLDHKFKLLHGKIQCKQSYDISNKYGKSISNITEKRATSPNILKTIFKKDQIPTENWAKVTDTSQKYKNSPP